MPDQTAEEFALRCFSTGFNWAESVAQSLVQALGIDEPSLPRMATGFGAGFARCGEVCGALSGAVIVLGLVFGRDRGDDSESKEATYARVTRLMKAFEVEFGTVICRELIGCDLATEEGVARFKAANMHWELCAKFVAFAAREGLRSFEG